ncbi:flagellar assembly protein FliH [Rhodovulum imhoffii]|uniref:Flagellar assembly protein FliH n=1 Tax=Rhodovulum imhoffii TaxID=365340 RepID=A0A2T5BRP0_9RHOB|nr:flagellar biosynthesis protein [Rhodovulum imhoffii]MBK5934067.1 hypothetical protein [Rhodovulum imhoffii]PTN01952.1 flagellar assembly protein FliH [Rhodovulum imhoffii]
MSSRLRLESFDGVPPDAPGPAEDTGALRTAAYEEGYSAGWDDAIAREAAERTRIGTDFAKTLQEMAFSYHEARSSVIQALSPLLQAMAERILPQAAQARFAETVLEAATDLAACVANRPVEIRVAPENLEALERLLPPDPPLPVTVTEDATLGPGQAWIGGPETEREVDIDTVLTELSKAVDDFLYLEQETRPHG